MSKIATYYISLREPANKMLIEAWERDDGSLCLYVWPIEVGVEYVDRNDKTIIVDWAGPDNYFKAGIGDPHEYPAICSLPEPSIHIALLVGVAVLKVMRWLK